MMMIKELMTLNRSHISFMYDSVQRKWMIFLSYKENLRLESDQVDQTYFFKYLKGESLSLMTLHSFVSYVF